MCADRAAAVASRAVTVARAVASGKAAGGKTPPGTGEGQSCVLSLGTHFPILCPNGSISNSNGSHPTRTTAIDSIVKC